MDTSKVDDIEQMELKIALIRKEIERKQIKLKKWELRAQQLKISPPKVVDKESLMNTTRQQSENIHVLPTENNYSVVNDLKCHISASEVINRIPIDAIHTPESNNIDDNEADVRKSTIQSAVKETTEIIPLGTRCSPSKDNVPLRRSSRRSRRSCILENNDFVIDNIWLKNKCTKIMFPKLSSKLVKEMESEFALPDEDYSDLKLQLNTTNESIVNGSCDVEFCQISTEKTDKLLSSNCTSDSQGNIITVATDLKPSNESLQQSSCPQLLLHSSWCDPIELIHHAETKNLKTDINESNIILITCQKRRVIVWEEKSNNNWVMLHTFLWSLEQESVDCKYHGFSTSSAIFITIIQNLQSKVVIDVYECFPHQITHRIDIISETQQKVSQILTCKVGTDVLIVGRCYATWTSLKKCDMSNDIKHGASTDLLPLKGDILTSILPIDGLLDAVIGVTSSLLCVWNHKRGEIVKRILLPEETFLQGCAFARHELGLLFLGLIINKTYDLKLAVLNPKTERWKLLHNYQHLEVKLDERITPRIFCHPLYVAEIRGPKCVIWDIYSGQRTTVLEGETITTMSYFNKLLLLGTSQGEVLIC